MKPTEDRLRITLHAAVDELTTLLESIKTTTGNQDRTHVECRLVSTLRKATLMIAEDAEGLR